ncbi:hypothetical protein KFE25_000748 [Diacronema lutheri]|uniref:Uncharacterized protein n=1 Tax=Diacronema lutheri TaxID=2081491 RepID=A0A8J5XS64_DIALT|nr:hypothetical protein KFE25_000748 [Diacronema lutheri]
MAFVSVGRKVAELEAVRSELIEEVKALSAAAAERDALLEQRETAVAAQAALAAELRAEVARLRLEAEERNEVMQRLQSEIEEERRTSARYLHEIAQQEKMLAMICAYRTDDERRDASRLIQENLGLEERVRQLKSQVRRLAVANVALEDEEG